MPSILRQQHQGGEASLCLSPCTRGADEHGKVGGRAGGGAAQRGAQTPPRPRGGQAQEERGPAGGRTLVASLPSPGVYPEAPCVLRCTPGLTAEGGAGPAPQHACAHASPCRVSAACPARERARNSTEQRPEPVERTCRAGGRQTHDLAHTLAASAPGDAPAGNRERGAGHTRCCNVERARGHGPHHVTQRSQPGPHACAVRPSRKLPGGRERERGQGRGATPGFPRRWGAQAGVRGREAYAARGWRKGLGSPGEACGGLGRPACRASRAAPGQRARPAPSAQVGAATPVCLGHWGRLEPAPQAFPLRQLREQGRLADRPRGRPGSLTPHEAGSKPRTPGPSSPYPPPLLWLPRAVSEPQGVQCLDRPRHPPPVPRAQHRAENPPGSPAQSLFPA